MSATSELSPILVVDNEQRFVELVEEYFSGRGVSVDKAYSGGAALMHVISKPPGSYKAMISDINMSTETEGMDILPELRKHDPHLPVIYLTGYGDDERTKWTIREGAVLLLDKPVSLITLHNCVFCMVLYSHSQRLATQKLLLKQHEVDSEKHNRELALADQRRRSELADREKRLVIGNLFNHNMKNIAFAAQAYLQTLSPQPVEVTKALRCLDGIVDQTLKLQAMSAEPDEDDFTPDLRAVVDQTRDELRGQPRFTEPERQLTYMPNGDIPAVHIKPDTLATLLGELAFNAVAHNPSPVNITVRAAVVGGKVEIRVTDDGVGVKLERVEKLFQVDPQRTEHGYGLPYSYQVARTHRGDLSYEATTRAFVLTLPVHGGPADA